MGMATTDDETRIAEDHALLEWAREAPRPAWDYDSRPSEDQRAEHERAVQDHYKKRPNVRNGYENDRR